MTFETGISDIAFGVVDLTPGDNAAAAFSYTFSDSRYEVSVWGPGGKQAIDDTSSGLKPVNHALAEGPSYAAVHTSGRPGEFSLEGAAFSNLDEDGRVSVSAMQAYTFTLSANSVLTLSGNFYQRVSEAQLPGYFQSGVNRVELSFTSPDLPIYGGYYSSLVLNRESDLHVDRDLWLAYANTSNQAVTIDVTFSVENYSIIYSDLPIAAVPEPSTWAMLAAGMLTVGAIARRRHRHA
ncbi:PEP-CTERM sorting domain-containing protein [Massilia sp. METH4]|uniref:PEP-CTERM sorting domain-containing protein n=1 Tax=Massilia sp. METH4 TaxID=3123041 RepID=UPI0030D04DCD